MIKRTTPVLLFIILLSCFTYAQFKRPIVLEGATVIDAWNSGPFSDMYIVIYGNTITHIGKRDEVIIPPAAIRIDVRGKYIMPGLIDAYATYQDPEDLMTMFSCGITTANIVSQETERLLEIERQSKKDSSRYPGLYLTVPLLSFPDDEQTVNIGTTDHPHRWIIPESADSARELVRMLAKGGIRRISIPYNNKLWCGDSLSLKRPITSVVLSALLDEAKKQNIVTTAMTGTLLDAQTVMDLNVNALLRGVLDQRIGSSLVDQLANNVSYYIPTLTFYNMVVDGEDALNQVLMDSITMNMLPQRLIEKYSAPDYRSSFRVICPDVAFLMNHLSFLYDNCGSIVKNYVPVPMGTGMKQLPGISAHLELENLVKSGLTPLQAIVSASAISAEFLGIRKNVGFLFPKYQADLLVLDKNPLQDIKNTRSISMIMKQGVLYHASDLRQHLQK